MFQAAREGLVGGWRRIRERGTLRLFLFEFVVVVLGVLTAQAVQTWSQDRERRRNAEAERFRLEQGFIDAVDAAVVWRAAMPCLKQRVGEIMRTAASGATLGAEMAQRPKFVQLAYDPATPETYALIAETIGTPRTIALEDVQGRMWTIREASNDIRSHWELFRLLDPEFGQATAYDRAAARAAGAAILAHLRSIDIALDMVERQASLITAKDATPFDLEFDILPVRNCAQVWAKGTAYRHLDPGEAPPR